MVFFTRLACIAPLIVSIAAQNGFYKMDFDVLHGKDLSSALSNFLSRPLDIAQRDGGATSQAFQATITNEQTYYVSNVTIGSPPVTVEVLLDSGSSDLWVMSSLNPHCSVHGGTIDCEQYGTFNQSASSTWKPNGEKFSISYLDNTYAKGAWGNDIISLTPQLKLNNATFAVADDSDSNVGVFGIAYQYQETADKKYTNIPALMKQQGFINKVAYSLYLGSPDTPTGTILFGGIDHAKYEGELVTIDIATDKNGQPTLLQIPLNTIWVEINNSGVTPSTSSGSGSDSSFPKIASPATPAPVQWKDFERHSHGIKGGEIPKFGFQVSNSSKTEPSSSPSASALATPIDINNTPIIVDSGTTLTLLPNATLAKVIQQITPQPQYNEAIGGYIVPCGLKQPNNYLNYDFNGQKTIKVPFTDLVLDAGHDNQGQMICVFGVVPNDVSIVGGNFLRSSYTVFNLDDNTISIAQAKFTNQEDILVIH